MIYSYRATRDCGALTDLWFAVSVYEKDYADYHSDCKHDATQWLKNLSK